MNLYERISKLERWLNRLDTRSSIVYGKGSFTPAFVGAGTAGTFTYTAAATKVEWTRIGNRLLYNGRIVITAISVAAVGTLTLTGFPYAAVADATMANAGGGPLLAWSFNLAAGYTDVNMYFTNGATAAILLKSGDNLAIANVQGGEIITGDWRFEGQYRIA